MLLYKGFYYRRIWMLHNKSPKKPAVYTNEKPSTEGNQQHLKGQFNEAGRTRGRWESAED